MYWFQWYNEAGDVDKAILVMMKALEKHSAAVTAGGWLLCLILSHCDPLQMLVIAAVWINIEISIY